MFGPDTASPQSLTTLDKLLRFSPLAGAAVAGFTYWLGARKRERDRRFEFYKASVITPCLAEIELFFENYRGRFIEIARTSSRTTSQATVPRARTKLHGEFSQDLYRLRDALVGRIEVYDATAVLQIDNAIGEFDTKVTNWLFSKNPRAHEKTSDEAAITELVLVTKRSLLQIIYKCNLKILN